MRFRGFSARTAFVRWGLAAVGIGIVLGGTAPTAIRLLSELLATHAGMVPWISSRLFGFIAYGVLAGSVAYGLLLSTKLLDVIAHRPITFTLHQDLASVGLGLAGIHGALLGLDRTVPTSLVQIAVPFATDYRPLWVGFGQLAFWIAAVVVASFHVRRRIGQRAWRVLHYATFLSFVGATAHGLGAGTDTAGWGWWIYLVATDVVVFLFVYRVVMSFSSRRRQAAPARVGPAAEPGSSRLLAGAMLEK
jgi:predicted ferric reductase